MRGRPRYYINSIWERLFQLHQVSSKATSFNTEEVVHQNVKFQVWDLAGQTGIRPYWKSYYQGSNGVIFVIDSTDRERLKTVAEEFNSLLEEEELKCSPIMIFANKQDLPDPMTPEEVSEILKLGKIKERDWAIFKTSAKTGEGLDEALNWLVKTVTAPK